MNAVNVSAFGLWQMLLKTKKQRVIVDGHSVRDLIHALNGMASGTLENEVLAADGRLDPKFKIFVNGKETMSLTAPLKEEDDVILFGVIDGG